MKITTVSVKCIIILSIGLVSAQIIEIDNGQIEGTMLSSRLGQPFYGFMGIPYAQAPINNLRFRAPVPVNSWTGVLDATSYGPSCYQVPRDQSVIEMSEDCLRINVFSPDLSGSLPVIVYFFGGGFVYGSVDQGRPENLMDRDVVVVNFNYRVGALGYLALGTEDVPGNAGMKDQVLALQWIQRNIARFGGNPNSVTIAGWSAGAVSVTSHMLSPMAQGLFHRVISMSGAIATTRTGTTSTGLVGARALASSLNCSETSDIEGMLRCLRQFPANEIVTAVLDSAFCEGVPWGPVTEPDAGQTRYFETDPDTLLRSGNFSKVPVLIGNTADEFANQVPDNLRFRAPVPVNSWTGVLDATSYGPWCYQDRRGQPVIEMSEDCLHINVFSPDLSRSLPVIVYVFGGGFVYGSVDQGRPENLMDRDVVVVNFNYRIGALGYLAFGTEDVPGNAGMKDQVLALQWIQRNIARFGGNPNSVTIAGLSAGAVSVTSHMLSPMAQGLFHRVISMSGAIATMMTGTTTTGIVLGRLLASSLNCSGTSDIEVMLTCLRQRTANEIVTASVITPFCESFSWGPITESDVGQTRYLETDPDTLLRNGNFSKVPVLIVITADEFANQVPGFLNSHFLEDLNQNFHGIAPCIFNYERDTARSRAFSDLLRQTLLPLHPIDVRSFDSIQRILSDGITYNAHRFVHYITDYVNVFYYKFSYIGQHSLFLYPGTRPFGVNHGDDLQYAFNAGPTLIPPGHPDHFMVERMTRIFESFALTGDPNYDSNEMNWPRHNTTHEFYMDIGTNMIEKHGLYLDRYAILDQYESSSSVTIVFGKILLFSLMSLLFIN